MTEPILDPAYWRGRLRNAKLPHHAVFRCDDQKWRRIAAKHRSILSKRIGTHTTVLDVGCGWGRVLDLMPKDWKGGYLGVDLSPDFVQLGRVHHPGHLFWCGEAEAAVRAMPLRMFDLALFVSFKHMVIRNLDRATWDRIELLTRDVCKSMLFLEYDEESEGEFVQW